MTLSACSSTRAVVVGVSDFCGVYKPPITKQTSRREAINLSKYSPTIAKGVAKNITARKELCETKREIDGWFKELIS